MAITFAQMTEEAMANGHMISAGDALEELKSNPDALLVDARDEAEVVATGLGVGAIHAPGRSIAWLADTEIDPQWQEPELQDRSRRIITTCAMSPPYRGAKAAELLGKMGFTDVSYVDGGMAALLEAGIETR